MSIVTIMAGTSVTLRATFKDVTGALKDPSGVTLRVGRPDGAVTVVSGGFTHPSTGVYERGYAFDVPGTYWIQWASTGDPAVVDEAPVRVRATHVPAP